MKITLDTESHSLAYKLLAYWNQPDEHGRLPGLVHDALLTGALSRGTDADVRREAVALVQLDGASVDLDISVPFGADSRIVAAGAKMTALAQALGVPADVAVLAAIRVGMRKLCPPSAILRAGGVEVSNG
jgi:hypothetical protein